MIFINLTNHPSKNWGEKQLSEALKMGEDIIDIQFPNVPPHVNEFKVKEMGDNLVKDLLSNFDFRYILVQGEMSLATYIAFRLYQAGKIPVVATTERKVVEDGEKKISIFEFVRFRPYIF